jgi:HD-GYP domain-containing protein (c-di-GMP phosphodiesterase class II)
MINKIKTSELREGMQFDKPVYIDGNNLLVPPKVPLKKKDIERLERWQIDEVHTDGNIIKEFTEVLNIDDIPIQQRHEANQGELLYATWRKELEQIFHDIKNNKSLSASASHEKIDKIANELLQEIEKQPQSLLQNLVGAQGKDQKQIFTQALIISSLNCACISTLIGKGCKMPHYRLVQLATASLLHDIGMLKVPDDIINKKGKLTVDELKKIRMHPIHSYQIIFEELKYPEDIALMVLYHHEKWDGTGYPKNIKGEAIMFGSRIIAVADAYEAMVNQRPYREAIIGYKAMKNLLSDNGTHFDPGILKIFLKSIGIYPIGSFVLLNNSMIAKVIEVNSNSPMRPKVEIIADNNGNKVEKDKVDLLEKKELFIIKVIDPKDLKHE